MTRKISFRANGRYNPLEDKLIIFRPEEIPSERVKDINLIKETISRMRHVRYKCRSQARMYYFDFKIYDNGAAMISFIEQLEI